MRSYKRPITPGKHLSRRTFLQKSAATAGVLAWTAPAIVRASDLNEKLNIAVIGCGGRGGGNLQSVSSENIVALCDVNERNLEAAAQKYPDARTFVDFRRLYDHASEFDAVVVSTCEHTHALATLPALQLGKHVYCEKPLTHNIWEARVIREAAARAQVATQMGTQIHAGDNYRRVVELVQTGAIGPVREVHVWVSRAWGWQGSAEQAQRNGDIVLVQERPQEVQPVPDGLHWDLWLGPAPERPFHSVYFPGPKWYRWWDFGSGTMSDLGSHWIDLPFWALQLQTPLTIKAQGPPPHPEIAPASMQVSYEYAARGDLPPLKLTWYQGTEKPAIWSAGTIPQWDSGALFVGDEGMLLSDYGKHTLLPEDKFRDVKRPDPFIPPSLGHHAEWLHACRTGEPTTCNFQYAGWLTEANHLGNVAYRVGKKLQWDPASLRATNAPEADALIRRSYRKGWQLLAVLLVLLLFSPGLPSAAQTPDLFVAPDGNDKWSGQQLEPNADRTDGPLATVAAAQAAVRRLQQQQPDRDRPITVAIRGGTYWLTEPITFGPDDSGRPEAPVIYEAYGDERPVLSGGRALDGWQMNDQGWWQLSLPEVASGDWRFVQLFVNDQRRFRARLPKQGYYRIASQQEASPAAGGRGQDRFGFESGQIDPAWSNLEDVEVVAFHSWSASRIPIASIDPSKLVVTLSGHTTGSSSWAQFHAGHRFFVVNVREALSEPGQWYLDRKSGQLTYIPRAGETPANVTVVAPRLRYLLLLKGDVPQRRWVQHLQLRGLTFAHSNWTTPPEGQSFPQAEINLGAAVAAQGARHVVLDRCAVRHTGEYAVAFGPGCRHNRVENCELVDLGAGGVKIGHALPAEWGDTLGAPTDEEALVSHHTVRNCLIAHGGRLHPAAIGVWIGHSPYNVIQHNDVYDFYYTAFSVGWVWGYHKSEAHHNDVGFNHAHTIGQGVLSDMGCVYTLGTSPGTVVHDNHFHDVVSYDYGGWGLYTDEGSTGIAMYNNLVYRCSRGGFHQHYGRENRIKNNIFAFGGEHQLQRTRTEDHISFFFERNIVYWDNDSPLLGSNWKDDNFRLDANVYWHAGKPVTFPGGLTLDVWRKERHQDEHSIVADPRFVDPEQGDFSLAADSPAFQIGFQPFDSSRAGRQAPVVLTQDLPPVPAGFE